jgi:hypothetical protein
MCYTHGMQCSRAVGNALLCMSHVDEQQHTITPATCVGFYVLPQIVDYNRQAIYVLVQFAAGLIQGLHSKLLLLLLPARPLRAERARVLLLGFSTGHKGSVLSYKMA